MNSIQSKKKENMAKKKATTETQLVPIKNKDKGKDKQPSGINDLDINYLFKLSDLYFNRYGIMYSHLYNSFNQFLDENIKNFLKNGDNIFFEKITKDKVIRYKFEFDNISVRPPMLDNEDELMFPSDARNRNLTYSAKLMATVTQIQEIVDIATDEVLRKVIGQPEKDVPLANIPIMMRSKYCSLNIKKGYNQSECEYDPGGYFLINGSEKVVISQERMVDNKPLVFIKKDSGSQIYTVQVNSRSNKINGQTQIITVRMKKDNLLNIRVPILQEIPVFILFRALGIESDKDIINYVVYDNKDNDMINMVRLSLDQSKTLKGAKIQTQEDALEFLMDKMRIVRKYSETDKNVKNEQKKMHLLDLLENNFIPHIEGNKVYKAFYLGYMINRLLQCYLGRIPADDRDAFPNKRIDLAGNLLEELFRQYYRKMLNECNKFFKKRNTDDENPLNIINQIKPNIIEQGLKAALLTGSWGRKKGVAQMLQRLTYLQTLSFLRRIDSPSVDAATSKLTNPRHLHPTQVGPMCLTGDSEVLMGDGVTVTPIKDMKDGDVVTTVNIRTFKEEPSAIYNWFSKMTDKLLKVTTVSGREIKCTPDHQLLTKLEGRYVMKKTEDFKPGDLLIIKSNDEYSKYKKYSNSPEILTKDEFDQKYYIRDDKFMIPIHKIEEIKPELVYDFTTRSNNHNFITGGTLLQNCVVETPEHSKVGLVKNLSMIGNITIMLNSQVLIIKEFLKDKIINLMNVESSNIRAYTKVFLNGEWVGMHTNPFKLVKDLRSKKLNGGIDATTSIIHDIDNMEIKIFCDGGRLYRPVLRVENNEVLLKRSHIDGIATNAKYGKDPTMITNWDEFMAKHPGVIEYIDIDEQMFAMVAKHITDVEKMRKVMVSSIDKVKDVKNNSVINRYDDMVFVRYNYSEIHASFLIGIIATNIPFCNHNQGPRNIFQYAQGQ